MPEYNISLNYFSADTVTAPLRRKTCCADIFPIRTPLLFFVCAQLQVARTCFQVDVYDHLSIARKLYEAEFGEDDEESRKLRKKLKEGKAIQYYISRTQARSP